MTKTNVNAILDISLTMFRERGYKRTSMSDIGRATGLLKHSLYYHFPTKEAILIAAMERVAARFEDDVFVPIETSGASDDKRLAQLLRAVLEYYLTYRSCLFVSLWSEAMNEGPVLQNFIKRFFDRWTAVIQGLLQPKYGAMRAHFLAEDAIARIQGGVIWLQISGSDLPLHQACRDIQALLSPKPN